MPLPYDIKNRFSDCTSENRFLKYILIGKMFHNIFHIALENITQTINGVYFHIAIVSQTIDLGTVDIIMGVQIILGNTTQLHGFPQAVVFNHNAATITFS